MGQDFSLQEAQKMMSDLLENKEKVSKKPLREILGSYLNKKSLDDDMIVKLKEKFLEMKLEMDSAKSSFDNLMEIQKKLVEVYKDLRKNEKD